MNTIKPVVVCAFALLLAARNPVESIKEGLAQSQAVSAELEKAFQVKSVVGFNWHNGKLASVNVSFDGLPSNAALPEIAAAATQSVTRHFKEAPGQIVLAFVIRP